jgi:adenine deaminase
VHTGESLEADVLVAGRHIAAVTPPGRLPAAETEVDAKGHHLLPGFIETHIHIDYCLLPPGELARLIVPIGTTALFADPNCQAYVFGRKGVELEANTAAPLRLFLQISSAIPAFPTVEQGGETLSTDEIVDYLGDPRTVSWGESNPFGTDDHILTCLHHAAANGRRVTGHTARLMGEPLWEYLAGGVCDDHNAATLEEAIERIRRGANLSLQSSSMSNYIAGVLENPELLGMAAAHIMFNADDKYADDLMSEGHIDHHLRSAVALGVPPVLAVRMATLNGASHFRVDHLIGSLTPARLADVVLVPDLVNFRPAAVWVGGRMVAEGGRALFDNPDAPYPAWVHESMRIGKQLDADDFAISASDGGRHRVRVIQMYDGYYKREIEESITPGADGVLAPDPSRDLAKVAVVDRHLGSGKIGKAFIRGFGLRSGALAVTTNCSNQNVVVVGTSDSECAAAVNRLVEMAGGFVVVDGGRSVAEVPLRYGGTMSVEPFEVVLEQLAACKSAAAALGCDMTWSPFMILSFIGLAGVPALGLTELGLIDVATQQFIPVVVGSA